MENRIYGNNVDINYSNTHEFFEQRGEGKNLKSIYNYVMFQDDNPELVILRDKQEKDKIGSILTWNQGEKVLDVGCGIARWGKYILEKGLDYYGIDYSNKLLEIARKNLSSYKIEKHLMLGEFQKINEVLGKYKIEDSFDKIFINGVLMYINDKDVDLGLQNILGLCSETCEIYIKESMGIKDRMTLKNYYSEDLSQVYSAIYRSIDEYTNIIQNVFGKNGFKIVSRGNIFDDKLNDRKETVGYYFVLRRINEDL